MRRLGPLPGFLFVIAFTYSAGAFASAKDFAQDAIKAILAATPKDGRAPLLVLTAQMPGACTAVTAALEAEARVVTNVYARDTADLFSEAKAEDVFNSPPGPSPFASRTKFEDYLDAHPFGGLVIFSSAYGDNAITAARVARIYAAGKHVSEAGHFKTSRQAFVLQASESSAIGQHGTLGSAMGPALWAGKHGECRYTLIDGDEFARRVTAQNAPAPSAPVDQEPSVKEFAQAAVTQIGLEMGPMRNPPLALLTPSAPGYSCAAHAASLYQVGMSTRPTYNAFSEGGLRVEYDPFEKFIAANSSGLILVRKTPNPEQSALSAARVADMILSPWLQAARTGYSVERFAFVLETTPEVEIAPGFTVADLLRRADRSMEAQGCRFSLIPGLQVRTILKHKCESMLIRSRKLQTPT